MKTVCKKLLCLMLVAMMLVSAVPFAFATEPEMVNFWIELWVDDAHKDSQVVSVPMGTDMDEAAVKLYAQQHLYGEYFGEGYTYVCVKEGKVADADNLGAQIYFATKAPETEPPVTEPPVTEPPVTEPPVTEPVPENYTLYFYYLNASGVQAVKTAEITNNEKVSFPVIPLVSTKDFLYWKDGDGNIFKENQAPVWNIGESQTFTAIYESNTTEDGLVPLVVYAAYYVDGEFHHNEYLYTEYFEETNKNTMFTWLYSTTGVQKTNNAVFGGGKNAGYQWTPVIYYNYYGDGAITEADMKTNGPKAVYIKVTSTDEIEASVMLYVHTDKKATVDRVIPMPGYTAGDYVSYADVKDAVKTKYSGKNMTISSLYNQSDWEDLLAGKDASGAATIKVENNGTTKIHVIVKNATASSGSTADSTNPKTGDNIMIAVTAMAISAAALVSVIELKKRKMI